MGFPPHYQNTTRSKFLNQSTGGEPPRLLHMHDRFVNLKVGRICLECEKFERICHTCEEFERILHTCESFMRVLHKCDEFITNECLSYVHICLFWGGAITKKLQRWPTAAMFVDRMDFFSVLAQLIIDRNILTKF